MQNWDEIKVAFHVALQGTASGAAAKLGVHHATVIRQVDALEKRLGVKLFQRHGRGFALTEAGQDLLDSVGDIDARLAQLETRLKAGNDSVDGELIVTSLPVLSPLLLVHMSAFRQRYPNIRLTLQSETRVFQMERGEAHVALRAGAEPDMPDYVVQRAGILEFAAFAPGPQKFATFEAAISALGMIGGTTGPQGPHRQWIKGNVPPEAISFVVQSEVDVLPAVQAGLGIGLLPVALAARFPELTMIQPPLPEWTVDLWMVTHVDLNRTAKVQAMTRHLKTLFA